ncbi:MAG: hypothetical protein AB7U20_16635 [Planctomycetaceae bacterium]
MRQIPDYQRHLYEALDIVAKTLERAGIEYAVAGGMAAGYWGEPRTTSDVDLVIAVSLDQIEDIKRVFADDPESLFDTDDFSFPDVRIVRVPQPGQEKDAPKIIAVDLLIYKDGYSKDVVSRRIKADFGDGSYWFCSGEDFVVMKLRAGRHRDLGDIETTLAVHGNELDLDFITQQAERVGKLDVWNELLTEFQNS